MIKKLPRLSIRNAPASASPISGVHPSIYAADIATRHGRDALGPSASSDDRLGWFEVHGNGYCGNRKDPSISVCDNRYINFCDPRKDGGMAASGADILHWLKNEIENRGRGTRVALAKHLGLAPEVVTRMLNTKPGKEGRKIDSDELVKMVEFFGSKPPGFEETGNVRTVPVVGYVSAGSVAHYLDPGGELERVPAPDGSTRETVSVEIRGDSLGSIFDRWLVFYDDIRSPVTSDLIGELCVLEVPDGRILVKKIKRSRTPGLYHLISNTEEPIMDAEISWAAKVKRMEPK